MKVIGRKMTSKYCKGNSYVITDAVELDRALKAGEVKEAESPPKKTKKPKKKK